MLKVRTLIREKKAKIFLGFYNKKLTFFGRNIFTMIHPRWPEMSKCKYHVLPLTLLLSNLSPWSWEHRGGLAGFSIVDQPPTTATVSLHQCMGHSMAMASLGDSPLVKCHNFSKSSLRLFSAPLISLVRDEYVQEQLAETARQFFSNLIKIWKYKKSSSQRQLSSNLIRSDKNVEI